jgi:hypothetical protein
VNKPRKRTKPRPIVSRETMEQLPAALARHSRFVIPAQAGTQFVKPSGVALLGSRWRGNDFGLMVRRPVSPFARRKKTGHLLGAGHSNPSSEIA